MVSYTDEVLRIGLAAGSQVPTVLMPYRERGKPRRRRERLLRRRDDEEETRQLIRSCLRLYRKDPEGFSRKGDF
jgi:hypothetical protein